MKIKKWFILAGGSATRWQGYQGVENKCELKIDGERLIDRTKRLMAENGITDVEVVEKGYNSKREAFEGIAKKAKGPFGILLGDCYYTEAIIEDAVNRDVTEWRHYYSPLANYWTGCTWAEGYIHLVPNWKWWAEKMTEFNKLVDDGKIDFKKDYQIDRYLRGYDPEERRVSTIDEHDIFWLDETDDFDYPADYDKFMERHERNKRHERPDMLSVIIPSYNNAEHLDKLLDNLVKQKMQNYDDCEIVVIDDGSTDNSKEVILKYGNLVKGMFTPNRGVSAARNAGLMASIGRYVCFVDSDDQVSENYVRAIVNSMREGHDYIIFCWKDVKSDRIFFDFDRLLPGRAVWRLAFRYDTIGKERFNEGWNVQEDIDWLERVVTPEKKRGQLGEVLYEYNWDANPDSLCKRFNRGDLPKERE